MPDVGRFFNIDPLSEIYNTWTPYAFSGNQVIDSRELEGLEPYKLFRSKEDAANNWGMYYNGQSVSQIKEYSSTIGESKDNNGNLYYSYAPPNSGKNASASPSAAPEGTKRVADIHSHGAYEEGYKNNEFSDTDKKDNDNKKIEGFLTTPNGSLKKYDPTTKKETIVNASLPSDPNDPSRKNKIDPSYKPIELPEPTNIEPPKIEPQKIVLPVEKKRN